LNELEANILDYGKLHIIDRKELDLLRGELAFQMGGEVSDKSMQELGQMLGAKYVVSGSLTEITGSNRLVIRVLVVETAAVAAQYRADIANDTRVQSLLEGGRTGGTATAATSGGRTQTGTTGGTTQVAASATAPRAGTYYFYPRLRAIMAGVDHDTYLDKVVVRGNFMTFYLQRRPTGNMNVITILPWIGDGGRGALLQDLDNPRRTWNSIRAESSNDYSFVTFENVTGSRFSLTSTTFGIGTPIIFEEIDLSKAEYEP